MLSIEHLGAVPYACTWQKMQAQPELGEALYVCEHPPVYTQGRHGLAEHILTRNDIPLVQTDRGGQVTYHGPGQLMLYPILNLRARKVGPKFLVSCLEQTVIQVAKAYGIEALARTDAPGVYVEGRKLASIGLRVKKGWSTHGLCVNLNVDPAPFSAIVPCGLKGIEMANFSDYMTEKDWPTVRQALVSRLSDLLIES